MCTDCASCSCCGGCGGSETTKLKQGEESEWVKKSKDLSDYKFKDVDTSKFRQLNKTTVKKYVTMLTGTSNYVLFFVLDVFVTYWLLKADPNEFPKARTGGILYGVFSGIGFAYLIFNIGKAVKIIKSDDVSDSFIHTESYRIRCLMSFDVFCFFAKVTAARKCKDKMVLYVYDSLYQLPQILLVKVPQIVIMTVNNDALKMFSDSKNEIPTSQSSANMKFSLLLLELALRAFAVFIMYPWLKCCMMRTSDLPKYANYLIESRINTLVKNGKADLNQEEEEDTGGKGCSCC